jgi:hypothetical protein
MDLSDALREALEAQVLDREPGEAAMVLRTAVDEHGAAEVADGLLDVAAVALRALVAETDEVLQLDELVEQLTLDGAVPGDSSQLLEHMLLMAASTAGGIRPTVQTTIDQIGAERALSGAWLATLAAIRVVAINLERTESDIVDDMVRSLERF